jgi:hypothetical protein
MSELNRNDLKNYSRSLIVEGQVAEEIAPEDHNAVNDSMIDSALNKQDDLAQAADFATLIATVKKYLNPYIASLFFLLKSAKATIAEVVAGTDNSKYITPASLKGAGILPGGGTGSQDLEEVLTQGNDAGGLQLKNVGNASASQDAVPLGQLQSLVQTCIPLSGSSSITGDLLNNTDTFQTGLAADPRDRLLFSRSIIAIDKTSPDGRQSVRVFLENDNDTLNQIGLLIDSSVDGIDKGFFVRRNFPALLGGDILVLDGARITEIDAHSYALTTKEWVLAQLSSASIPDATSSVKGKAKLFTSTGAGTDGSITQAATTAAIAAAQTAAQSYADALVVGLWDDRGSFSALAGAYPTTGGSGPSGAIKKGDTWTISAAGTLPTSQVVGVGDVIRALVDTPGNSQANWAIQENNLGYTAENSANKSATIAGNESSTTLYTNVKGVVDWMKQGFTGLLSSLSLTKTTPLDADSIIINDSADSNKTKLTTWANVKATLKAYFDTLYSLLSITTQTGTSYAFVLADAGTLVRFNNAAPVTVIVPLNSSVAFPIGTSIEARQSGAGAVTISPTAGVTINSPDGLLVTGKQFDQFRLVKQAADAWLVVLGAPSYWTWVKTQAQTVSGIWSHSAAINEAQGADIASASTTDLGAATGNYVNITGTTPITSLGTIQAGTRRLVRFAGALTLTHNSTSLILPSSANITTVSGDVAHFVSLGAGNWKCVNYQRQDGTALVGSSTGFAINIEFENGSLQATEYFKTAATLTFNKRESTIATLQYSTNGGSSFTSLAAGTISILIPADTFVIFKITYVSPSPTSRGTIYLEAQ